MRQTVYVDVLLSINLFVDYFLLLSVKYFFALPAVRLRLLLGSLCGAAGSMIIFLPHLPSPLSFLLNFIICSAMVSVAFLPVRLKKWLRLVVCTYLLCFGYAGAMLAVWTFIAPQKLLIRNAIVYFDVSPLLLAVLTVFLYMVFKLLGKLCGRRENGSLYCRVCIGYQGKRTELYGKIDTGNTLTEPFSGDPVLVACAEALLPLGRLPPEEMRVIPYGTLAGQGLLYAFRPEELLITYQKKKYSVQPCFVAVYEGQLERGCYQALLSPELLALGKEELP